MVIAVEELMRGKDEIRKLERNATRKILVENRKKKLVIQVIVMW